MLLYGLLLCVSGVAVGVRPRGVRVELASFYNPATDFACLDGSGVVPYIQVNDDYCDCDDGSDEPGTAACPDGRFYCENRGHNPLVLPSSRVNDGICDCCDGSDEWEAGSLCQDTCMDLGRVAREAAIAQAKLASEGFNIKQGMIQEGKVLQEDRVAQLSDKEKAKQELEAKKEDMRVAKEAAEAPEKEALDFYRQMEEEENKKKEEEEKVHKDAEAEIYFKDLDVNQDGVISLEELQSRQGLDTDKDGTVSEEEAKFFLSGHDQFDLETFKSVGLMLLKPYLELGQAQAGNTPDPAAEEGLAPPTQESTESTEPAPADPQVYDPWRANQKNQEEEGEAVDSDNEDYEDGEEKDEVEDYDIADTPVAEITETETKVEDKYDEQTRALIAAAEEARKRYEEIDRQLRDVDSEISKIKNVMEKDYGYDHEFAVLSGQCFEYTDNEYVYKMCPFDSCNQRSKSGGSETRLGSWKDWQGPEGNRYSKMKYSDGQQCWNGPSRSANVILHCGSENVVTSVSEPNRCEYEMHFTTPAACDKPNLKHDEL